MSRFAIGDSQWAGLGKLVEETGEVQQVAGKIMGCRGAQVHYSGDDLKAQLQDELADLLAAIDFVVKHNDLDKEAIVERLMAKLDLFENWHQSGN